jgi:nitroimidazol reductase NimA-like FMN-containing flavoprotein (pyridoxamine 5'-phosphate oxidase superfamily)
VTARALGSSAAREKARPASSKSVPLERRGDYVVKMYDLEEDVCRRLLTRCTFGRVAFVDKAAGLTVLPVNYVVSHDAVVFRVQRGSTLDRVAKGGAVAFEADQVDPARESGWSVLVRGTVTHLRDPRRLAALSETTMHPWAPGSRDRWVEIHAEQITGRIVRRDRLPAPGEHLPYMSPD